MKIAILGTRGIPNNYGGFEQCAEYLSVGLVEKGHEVTVYSPKFHPYREDQYKGVKIIRKSSPQNLLGNSLSNFIYDYLCFKDASSKDFDIILELGLITSSLSIIFCNHGGKVVATNLDGLEWKRSKWNVIIQKLTKTLERYGVKHSDYLIADNKGIQEYIKDEYNRDSEFIAYGTVDIKESNSDCLDNYGIKENYLLSIARMEPENNLEMMFDAYLKSGIDLPYYVVGNHYTIHGNYLKNKYRNKGIIFLGGIFNKGHLDNIRYYSKYYLHGHSVGGTNPALLEAMSAKTLILAHNNQFNKSVLGENAFYFSSTDKLSKLFKQDLELKKKEFTLNNLSKIDSVYRWPIVIDQYESYFQRLLKKHQKIYSEKKMNNNMRILTFDIVDWFHIIEPSADNTLERWSNYEVRIHNGMDRIFKILDEKNIKATFFILGYIAKKHPEIVKRIHDLGYEVAAYYDKDAHQQSRIEFKQDLQDCINSLESITGEKVLSYRAPGFSIKKQNVWVFEVLNELGIKYDASISSVTRWDSDFNNSSESTPAIIKYNGMQIKEFPMSVNTVFGQKFNVTGGGYFRLLPYRLIRKWLNDVDYTMTYFHPRDFDPSQPMLDGLSLKRKFKSYYNLSTSYTKLRQLVYDFDFIDMREAAKIVDWNNVPIIDLSHHSNNK